MEFKHYSGRRFFSHLLSAPVIYSMIIPLVILDFCFEVYHRICFALYGIAYIERSRYIKIDRYRLSYLKPIEKINCMYCGYANGLLHYVSVICAETERYWCGIKHSKDKNFIPPEHHKDFLPYGDERAYKKFLANK